MIFLMAALCACTAGRNWRPLFNGVNLEGWQHIGKGQFSVANSTLVTQGGMGLLWYTGQKFGHCQIRLLYKTEGHASNSGVFIRIPETPADPWDAVYRGYEVQIDDSGDDFHCTGTLYSLTRALARPGRPGMWNTLLIELSGPRTRVWINHELVTDFTEGDALPGHRQNWEPQRGPRPEQGYIGLQNHQIEDNVCFKDIAWRPL